MNPEAAPDTAPTDDAMLTQLATCGMRFAHVLTRVAEIEQAAADVVAAWLPTPGAEPASAQEATQAGLGVDAVTAQMAGAVPRLDVLARAFDRVSRSVRRCIALRRRVAAGWPRPRSEERADDRAAMERRQVARGVAEAIGRATDDEDAAERLFDDLAERLEDPAVERALAVLPVDEVVRRICRDLGLAAAAMQQAGVAPGAVHGGSREPPSG